jgi:membrane-bound inhibitor of C-type lysozyme
MMRMAALLSLLAASACASGGAKLQDAALLRYQCEGGLFFALSQRDGGDWAVLTLSDQGAPIQMKPMRTGSGFGYAGPGARFHAKGDGAILSREGKPDLKCMLQTAGAP